MNKDIYVKKNIFIILAIVLLLGIVIEATRSQFILQVSSNQANDLVAAARKPKKNGISAEGLSKLKREKFLIVYDSQEDGSGQITENVKHVLDYMKKEYETIDVKQLATPSPSFMTLIVTVEDLNKFPDLDAVLNYAEHGGRVFFARTPEYNDGFYQIYRKLGVNAMGSPVVTKGIKMTSNLLIQGEEAEINENLVFNTSIPVELQESTKVYAVAADQEPLLWDVAYGKGKLMLYNGTNLHSSMNRGIIAGAVSVLNPDFMYPIINMKVMYIDDFPSPFRQGIDPNIYQEYKKDIPDFYRDIWWPDMIRLAADYDVVYTGALIKTYNDRVEPPFEDHEGTDKNNLITYGRDLLKLGGELGIHGYNHQSLVTDQSRVNELGYNAWPSEQNMTESLRELDEYIKRIFSNYAIRVYVPPSNVMAEEGRQALKNSFPHVNIIASLYAESANNLEYIQEFSQAEDGIIEMPRITSGYANTDLNNWYIANAATSIGVFSHFVHPDDILDKARSKEKTWPVLSKEFRSMMKSLYDRYPWLRSMTASEGGSELSGYLQTKVYLQHEEDKITGYMNDFATDMYFVLRTDKKMTATENCTVELIDEGVYLVHATKANFQIGLKG
ncbi:DUF2194 domain-containing protein [Brevibacillus choshinensis]|uniref:DUF2194 domain-containing protein n=1 Tax=Brevibacillus choshinensis TaxID=54911 RepID=UPI002E1A46E9|nr:DUF2194 domain-containing protein [Brevibacillus choshinensis]MED4752928.1 DUF2194 domain-containing protein [Brevibacillus choshinensis]